MKFENTPEHILSNDVHELQSGTDEEDDIFDISRGEPAALKGEHLFHFMFLCLVMSHILFDCVLENALSAGILHKAKAGHWKHLPSVESTEL